MDTVYLDHAATTPLDERVLEAMLPYMTEQYGNASSVHALGRKARFAVEDSREKIAELIGAAPGEIVFTSGGTEADNMAIRGAAAQLSEDRRGILTSAVEHKAVLAPVGELEPEGFSAHVISPDGSGRISADRFADALTDDVGLVSLMHVNNELGSVTPIEEIAAICREQGILLHCDAVQSAGYFNWNLEEMGVDLLSMSGHKLYGPKGIGILYIRGGTDLRPIISGGGQERERRGGTENVPAVVGMARAFELAVEEREERRAHLMQLRKRLLDRLQQSLNGGFIRNGPGAEDQGAPHVVNIAFPPDRGGKIDGEMLLLNLDMKGVCVSSGSACTSGAVEPSHVLQAIGLDRETASAGVRLSPGKDNTAEEIDYAVEALAEIVGRMR